MVVNSFCACIRITKNALLSQRHHSTQAHACHVICHRPTSPACRSDPIITRTASAELLGTFELLHLELLRGGLHPDGSRQDAANASAAAASAAAAAARKPRRFPAGGAEDKDMQASRLHSRRLTTLPSGRALSRPNRSMKLCNSFEIPTPPSDPASALFYRAPSVSARISSVRVRYEPYGASSRVATPFDLDLAFGAVEVTDGLSCTSLLSPLSPLSPPIASPPSSAAVGEPI